MKKNPLYVIDRTRNLIFGQFFQQSSADEVERLLRHHSATKSSYDIQTLTGEDWQLRLVMRQLDSGELRKGTERDLKAIDAEKYLPTPDIRGALFPASVVVIGASQQYVILEGRHGRKWTEWKMRGLNDGKPYSYKTNSGSDGRARFVRMATPNEYHRAIEQREEINQNKQRLLDKRQDNVEALNIEIGDVVTVNYRDVGHRNEVVEDINHKTGRVAIRRRGLDAAIREKRRFIPATAIVKVVEKVGYYNPRNPVYAKYGFGNELAPAEVLRARREHKAMTGIERILKMLKA